jgi:hypothetical protein
MKLQQIVERLEESHPSEWEYDKIAYHRLMDDLCAYIAERALPVTREWLLTIGDKWHAPSDVEYIFIGEAGEKNVLVSCGEKCFIVWQCIGSAICYVTTRGQLLDLLSGLGVTK